MKKFIGVLIFVFTGSLLMGCGIIDLEPKPMVQQSTIGIPGQCSSLHGSAVTVTAFYGNNPTPLTGLNIRYRVNGDDWQNLPETTTETTPIIGPAGTYNIEVRKESYPLQTAVVFVPQDEGCTIMEQNLEIIFHHPASCPPPPQVIILDVVQPHISDGLSIQVEKPTGETTTEQCRNGQCTFNLQTESTGNYNVVFVGFPAQREMYLENYVVHYSYMNVEVHVRVGERTHQIVTEGVDNINLIIPFNFGDSGCLEVLFN